MLTSLRFQPQGDLLVHATALFAKSLVTDVLYQVKADVTKAGKFGYFVGNVFVEAGLAADVEALLATNGFFCAVSLDQVSRLRVHG